mgnify:CR=1
MSTVHISHFLRTSAVKAAVLLLYSVVSITAGSATAVSNRFSLGKPANVIKKSNSIHNKYKHVMKMRTTHSGVLFEIAGNETINSLLIIDINGRIVAGVRSAGVSSIFWDRCSSAGVGLSAGCYFAIINNRHSRALILTGKESDR